MRSTYFNLNTNLPLLDPSKNPLFTSIEFLKGVGPNRASLLTKELDIRTWNDLIHHFPFRYIDKTQMYSVSDLKQSDVAVQFKATVTRLSITKGKFKRRLTATLRDQTGTIRATWFQGINWVAEKLVEGREYLFFAKASNYKGAISISHPEFEEYTVDKLKSKTLEPVYPSTELLTKTGLESKLKRTLIKQVFSKLKPEHFLDYLGPTYTEKLKLSSHASALYNIHFPKSEEDLQRAQARLKFEELFFLQLGMIFNQQQRKAKLKGAVFAKVGDKFMKYFNEKIPFELTGAQKKVIKEIRNDLGSGIQMNRLLQGDVGSGKTMVALLVMLLANDNGYQACMMAPTEILAQQHYTSIAEQMKGMGIHVGFLSGSVKGKRRAEVLKLLKEGVIHILIGTHALIEDWVVFKQLGVAIIDEQHRFGVAQRAALWSKTEGIAPHILVMTATPIPRTLALTAYGDLEVSTIDELPPGRKPIKTVHMYDTRRVDLNNFIETEIKKGRQVYIVYPLIEESSKLDLQNLEDGYERLLQRFPRPKYQISVVHGKLKAADKESEMQRFVRGETQIMVATTVIEVGVNVPNASVMIIENSERFGLSQLHQLRGRVGRGSEKSYCILMSGYNLSINGKKRLETMVRTQDGFEIAEVDLELRGPGNIEGTQQSGVMDLNLASIVKDQELMIYARNIAKSIIHDDPFLQKDIHIPMHNKLKTMRNYRKNWGRIS